MKISQKQSVEPRSDGEPVSIPPERTIRGAVVQHNGQSRDVVAKQTRDFYRSSGGGTESLKTQLAFLEAEHQQLQVDIQKISKSKEELSPLEEVPQNDRDKRPLSRDTKAQVGVLAVAIVLFQFGGMTVLASTIVESGMLMAIDSLAKAYPLTLVIPLASFLLKYAVHVFPSPKAKRIYEQTVALTAIIALCVWIVSSAYALTPLDPALLDPMEGEVPSDDRTLQRMWMTTSQLVVDITGTSVLASWIFKIVADAKTQQSNNALKQLDKMERKKRKRNRKVVSGIAKFKELIARKEATEDAAVQAADSERALIEYRMEGPEGRPRSKALVGLLALGLSFFAPNTQADDKMIVFGGGFTEEQASKAKATITGLYRDHMKRGDSLIVFDNEISLLASVTLPENSRNFDRAPAKLRYGPGLNALRATGQWIDAHMGKEDDGVNLPKLARKLSEEYPGREQTLLLIGRSQLQAGGNFNLRPAMRASDSIIASGSPRDYVFGTKDAEEWLKGKVIHWMATDDWQAREKVRMLTLRMWGHYVAKMGGDLVSFSDNIPARRVATPSPASGLDFTPPLDHKEPLKILRIHERSVALEELQSSESAPPPPVPVTLVGPVTCFIKWTGDIDLDIHAQSSTSQPVIYYGNPQSSDGSVIFSKDHRSSPNGHDEYEYIEYKNPVDISKLRINVNFYGGRTGPEGANGELKIRFDGKTYSKKFNIPATSGNAGEGGSKERSSSKHWFVADPLAILGHRRIVENAEPIR